LILKLLSYNIRFGGAGREDLLAEVIHECEPDLIILQEATKPHVVERLAQATGMNVWGARPGHSLGFISRLEITHHEWHPIRGSRRSFLEILLAGLEVRVFGLHLSAIHSNWTERRRVRELRALLAGIKQHPERSAYLVRGPTPSRRGNYFDTRSLPLRLRPFVRLSGGKIRWETIQMMLDAATWILSSCSSN
jgi:exodeoxyribonuclease-3